MLFYFSFDHFDLQEDWTGRDQFLSLVTAALLSIAVVGFTSPAWMHCLGHREQSLHVDLAIGRSFRR
jgi:hypothetical protein